MAAKKKNKKTPARSKKSAGRASKPAKKIVRKRSVGKKSAQKKAVAKKKGLKQATGGKTTTVAPTEPLKKKPGRSARAFSRATSAPSGEQSGDLQGLSRVESADSESVDELVEEGNAFEAGVVSGVEDSERRGTSEVRTREVLEDDVPEEYLDKD